MKWLYVLVLWLVGAGIGLAVLLLYFSSRGSVGIVFRQGRPVATFARALGAFVQTFPLAATWMVVLIMLLFVGTAMLLSPADAHRRIVP